MIALIVTVLVTSLGTAVVGTVVTGLFWLTLVSLAVFLTAGAGGVSRFCRGVSPDEVAPAPRLAELRLITSTAPSRHDAGLGRAA
jgi:hypothetical protein